VSALVWGVLEEKRGAESGASRSKEKESMDERVGSGTADVTLSGVTAGFRKGVVLNRGAGFRLAPTPASVWRGSSSGE